MSDKKRRKVLWTVKDVENSEGEFKSFWTRIGAAFENKDGSWSLEFDALPVNGRVQMRDPRPGQDREAA